MSSKPGAGAAIQDPDSRLQGPLEKCSLILILPRYAVTMPAPRLVRLAPANHDDRTVPQRRLAVHQALISRRRAAAHYADRLELVHHFGGVAEPPRDLLG